MDILSQICFQNDWSYPTPMDRTGYLLFTGVNWAREEQFQSHTLSTHQILRPILTVNE